MYSEFRVPIQLIQTQRLVQLQLRRYCARIPFFIYPLHCEHLGIINVNEMSQLLEINIYIIKLRPLRIATASDCQLDGCGHDSHSRVWIVFFSSLWYLEKVRHWSSPLNMQCVKIWAESGNRRVFTLDFLCLPYYMEDTAWSWTKNFTKTIVINCHVSPAYDKVG